MSDGAPTLLAFDTSAAHCAAALLSGGRIVATAHEDMGRGQAERLFGLLQEVLTAGGADWGDLNAIGVGIGPGNFTGIRISVAAARGLALSLAVPAVGVTIFEAVALGTDRPVLACLPAPRGEVYAQLFEDAGGGEPVLIAAPYPAGQARDGLICVGPAAGPVAAALGAECAPAAFAPAEAIARIAATRWQAPGERPKPLYLRPADAAPPRNPAPAILP